MAKLTAWLVTLIGVLLVLPEIGVNLAGVTLKANIVVALAVLIIGIGKLMRNYQGKRR